MTLSFSIVRESSRARLESIEKSSVTERLWRHPDPESQVKTKAALEPGDTDLGGSTNYDSKTVRKNQVKTTAFLLKNDQKTGKIDLLESWRIALSAGVTL